MLLQDYPEFEILFGIARADDPAREDIERLMREFPEVAMRLLLCSTAGAQCQGGRVDGPGEGGA